jgi:hypothetical protein
MSSPSPRVALELVQMALSKNDLSFFFDLLLLVLLKYYFDYSSARIHDYNACALHFCEPEMSFSILTQSNNASDYVVSCLSICLHSDLPFLFLAALLSQIARTLVALPSDHPDSHSSDSSGGGGTKNT